ncbi:hypothetical protein [Sphingobacterium sp. LRF_L2]|uniref:hypothetical protein n=1 Tax=Sphingobacterium sp. LRF_L2 TaxID=3369421 RepID=UPI003F603D8D
MSEIVYKRNVCSGLPMSMCLNGTGVYFEEDLLKDMEESRNKDFCFSEQPTFPGCVLYFHRIGTFFALHIFFTVS